MKRVEVKVPGYKDCYVTGLKLSARFKWERDCRDEITMIASSLLSLCVVDAENKPIMSLDEWDEFGIDNADVCLSLYNKCLDMVGSVETAAKK